MAHITSFDSDVGEKNRKIFKENNMAEKTRPIFFDGEYYDSQADVPDLGSWEYICGPYDKRRSYQGLSADVAKLPKYDDLLTGSSALCVDTGDVYLYHKGTKNWYKQ